MRKLLRTLRGSAWRLHPARVHGFLQNLPANATVLDVGCGNESARRLKRSRPDIVYTGVDVGNFHQTATSIDLMDEYIIVPAEDFSEAIRNIGRQFDAVLSSHNIEHCNDPRSVLANMAASLNPGGRLYLAFPSEESVTFPNREGTLNFYDDPTHREVPIFNHIISTLEENGLTIEKAIRRYRPTPLYIFGLFYEPISRFKRRVDHFGASWSFWGFESIIWARSPLN